MTELSDRWVAQGSEVFYPRPGVLSVTPEDIAALKQRAGENPRKRCRICLHQDPSDALHDMVIALGGGSYDRPHRHFIKAETMIAIEGEATYVRFDPNGTPVDSVRFSSSPKPGFASILRSLPGEFHCLLIRSEWFVFCESTLGPFNSLASEFAPWSPSASDETAVARYLAEVATCVANIESA